RRERAARGGGGPPPSRGGRGRRAGRRFGLAYRRDRRRRQRLRRLPHAGREGRTRDHRHALEVAAGAAAAGQGPRGTSRVGEGGGSGMAGGMGERTVEALDHAGSTVRVRLAGGGEIEVDHVVLLFGYRPNTNEPWLAELALATDALGYLVVDGNMETSCRGVFAVGDVSKPAHPCIATAIGSGTVAARTIEKRLARERATAS